MDLRQLRYFLAVVEEGSLTAAAQRLHMTQPPLSLAIARLEKDLQVKLLHRYPRGVAPTEAGEHFATTARRILTDTQRLREAMRAIGAGVQGKLRIGAEPIGLWSGLADRIRDFTAGHPDASLTIVDRPPGRLMDLMFAGELDFVVVPSLEPQVLSARLGAGFATTTMGSVDLTLVAPAGWTDLPAGPIAVADVMDRTWILPQPTEGMRMLPEAVDEVFARAGRRPSRIIEASTPHTGLSLVDAGVGVSVVSVGVAEYLPGIRRLDLEGGFPPLTLVALSRHDLDSTPIGRHFTRTLFPDRPREGERSRG